LRIRAPFRHFVTDPYMGWNETSQANPTHPPRCRDQELTELIKLRGAIAISIQARISNYAWPQPAQMLLPSSNRDCG
jgi:hypothetical protein